MIVLNFGFSFVNRGNFNFLTEEKFHQGFLYYGIVGIALLVCPVFGWIADVYWGRYKMIRRSLQIMWLATIGFCLISVIPDYLPHATTIKKVVNTALLMVLFLSLGGVQVNIIQFGVDQLPDASSNSITAFSNWYALVYIITVAMSNFSQKCVCSKYIQLAKLLLPACTTLALCLDYNFNHWLIKEPVSENPLKLIYRVVHYVWKNKYPRQRSAFTYCEDKRYSRIDFAKQEFGGPFTTEQVEDVKTISRILFIFIKSLLYIGFMMNVQQVAVKMSYHLKNSNIGQVSTICSEEYATYCYQKEMANISGFLVSIVFILLHELVLRHIYERCSSFMKLNIGMLLSLISMIGYFSLEIAGHISLNANITNVTCLLEVKENDPNTWNSLPLDYKWIMLPELFRAFSYFFMISGGVQFICAQSPYSMKGLVTGLGYALFGLSFAIIYLMLLPITYTVHKWPPNRYGCGTWYLLAASTVFLLAFIIAVIISRRYRKRQRDDVLPNEHIFAINYYSRYIMYNSVD